VRQPCFEERLVIPDQGREAQHGDDRRRGPPQRRACDLLRRELGYGGSRADAAQVVGRGGDEGIDGVINEDRLGLDTIYVQAKRWQGTVGRPEIQRFAGALQGQRARKGVFITTSSFSADARAYAAGLQTAIVLIDGPTLARLMMDAGVGVSEAETIRVLRADEDYFDGL
jgi:restriction system protein